jgi:hypothetical protein
MFDSIYGMTPINKTAAIVTSQDGCASGELSDEQMRENLCANEMRLKDLISAFPKKSAERKKLADEHKRVADQIKEINSRIKHKRDGDINNYIIYLVKKRMTRFEWSKILDEAYKLKESNFIV